MTKQATSIRLSAEAEQNIKTIRTAYSYLADKTAAIEFAVWVVAHASIQMPNLSTLPPALRHLAEPAARPARTKAATKEQTK